ncbi:MAG TPA: hypothetical protein VJI75_02525 [Candidatus Nanoarchaeia archaeon]|nr:hypothetical protein [Candidatus Nanoarchaeia archaeon]
MESGNISANVLLAKSIINRYPEVFESLLEYEKTKKLRKLYRRARFNITIDENVLRDFKAYCAKNNINMSRALEKKMLEMMSK